MCSLFQWKQNYKRLIIKVSVPEGYSVIELTY